MVMTAQDDDEEDGMDEECDSCGAAVDDGDAYSSRCGAEQ
jgi:hypothetical protein